MSTMEARINKKKRKHTINRIITLPVTDAVKVRRHVFAGIKHGWVVHAVSDFTIYSDAVQLDINKYLVQAYSKLPAWCHAAIHERKTLLKRKDLPTGPKGGRLTKKDIINLAEKRYANMRRITEGYVYRVHTDRLVNEFLKHEIAKGEIVVGQIYEIDGKPVFLPTVQHIGEKFVPAYDRNFSDVTFEKQIEFEGRY